MLEYVGTVQTEEFLLKNKSTKTGTTILCMCTYVPKLRKDITTAACMRAHECVHSNEHDAPK